MKTRILMGMLLAATGLILIALGSYPLFIWILVLAWMVSHEVFSMISKKQPPRWMLWGYLPVTLSLLAAFMPQAFAFWKSWPMAIVIVGFLAFLTIELFLKRLLWSDSLPRSWARIVLLLSLTLPFIYLVRAGKSGLINMLFCCLMVWSSDSFALFGGKLFGKHKLSSISPNKTIEGSISGILGALIFAWLFMAIYNYLFVGDMHALKYTLYAILISVLSQMGDLHESLTKRYFNVKDSSNLIPGHGGIYDRADSYLFVMPLMFYLMN